MDKWHCVLWQEEEEGKVTKMDDRYSDMDRGMECGE
jgi:hypothetical protein